MPEVSCNINWIQIIISFGAAIFVATGTAFLGYYFGFRQYLRQKNWEHINKIYIQEGIDKIIETLDKSCFICQFNFGKAMRLLDYMEDSAGDIEIEKKITEKIFSEMEPLVIAPENSIYKLEFLTGGDKILSSFVWIIRIMADYLQFNDHVRYALLFELEHYSKNIGEIREKRESFLKELRKRVVNFDKNIVSKHEMMKVFLLRIKKRIDEIHVADIKDLNKVSKDKKIKEILKELQDYYEKNVKIDEK